MTELTTALTDAVRAFVAREARLADTGRYADWEALWADDPDVLYWIPSGDDSDRNATVSYVNDNRTRLASRVKQWQTGRRWSGEPASRLARVVSELEITADGDLVRAEGTFVLVQHRETTVLWAGTVTYMLRPEGDSFRLISKKVDLVNRADPIPTLSFIL